MWVREGCGVPDALVAWEGWRHVLLLYVVEQVAPPPVSVLAVGAGPAVRVVDGLGQGYLWPGLLVEARPCWQNPPDQLGPCHILGPQPILLLLEGILPGYWLLFQAPRVSVLVHLEGEDCGKMLVVILMRQ